MLRKPNYCAWAVLGADGKMIVGPRQGEDVNPGDTTLAALLEKAIAEVGGAESVYVLDFKLADILKHGSASITALTTAPPLQSRPKIEAALQERAKKLCNDIILYTDASKGTGATLGTGWSITYPKGPDPVFGSSSSRAPVGVSGAELIAIQNGLSDIAFMHGSQADASPIRVTIRSDSQSALRIVSSIIDGTELAVSMPHPYLRDVLRSITEYSKQFKLRTEWVRGHNGDPGNEAADRLAVSARRVAELGTPADVARNIFSGIITDERPNLKAA